MNTPIVTPIVRPWIAEVRYVTTARGARRAFFWSNGAFRWVPLPVTEADLAVASGQADDITDKNTI